MSVNVSDGGVPKRAVERALVSVEGVAGENLTVRGVRWAAMTPGARFRAGTAEAEVTGYANPCGNLRACFAGEDIARVSQKLHPGWSRVYARVLRGGVITAGDPFVLLAP
ncbi:MAG: MOSC domain-containing protein [Gemmatimonadaceae bacterium]